MLPLASIAAPAGRLSPLVIVRTGEPPLLVYFVTVPVARLAE
jgi:hypothetical protein